MARHISRRIGRIDDALRDSMLSLPPLLAAAAAGEQAQVETLLAQGTDVGQRDDRGQTALHHAVKHGHAGTSACLLVYGADPHAANMRGRPALAADTVDVETLHAIRQRYRRFRRADFAVAAPSSARVQEWLEILARDGIVKISGLVDEGLLAQLRDDFQQFVAALERQLADGGARMQHYDEEEHFWPEDNAYVCNNMFKYSAALARFCCQPELVETASRYVGRQAHITRAVAMRYQPVASRDNDMFGWHHDLDEKRLKMQVLLTDVSESDQHMSYVAGSQQLYHPYRMFFRNECPLDYCEQALGPLRIINATGRAGDVFLFDSNGAHRGCRKPQAQVRDALFIEYNADTSNIWGGDVASGALDGLSFPFGNPLERLMAAERKWLHPVTRKAPTWIENMSDIDRWLYR